MNKFVSIIIALICSVAITQPFAAVNEPEPPAQPPAKCDLTFASGKAGKGYSNFVRDIKAVCPSLPVCDKESEGGLQNLTLLSTKEADIALVQVDTLMQMQGSDDQLKQMQVVASLHSNLLHVLTKTGGIVVPGQMVPNPKYNKWNPMNKEPEMIQGTETIEVINKFSDLKGKTVGVVGSAQLLARKLNDASGHGMQFIDYTTDAEAVKALNAEGTKIHAVLTMGAWPHGYVKELKADSGLKLVNYDLAPTQPYTKTKKNYQKLGQFGIEFLAASNVIVTRPFVVGGQNAKNVAAVKNCIVGNLGKLKDGKYEPGWGEVTNLEEVYGLPKFVSSGTAKKK